MVRQTQPLHEGHPCQVIQVDHVFAEDGDVLPIYLNVDYLLQELYLDDSLFSFGVPDNQLALGPALG